MATRTIHTLAYKLLVDSKDFTKGTTLSRKEVSFLKREMRSTLSPAEKMEVSLHKLGTLAKKDAQFQHLYNVKLSKYRDELRKSTKQAGLFNRTFGKSAGLVKASLAGISIATVARAVDRQIDRIDRLKKASDKIGVSTEFASRLQFIADRTAGLDSGQTLKGLEKMTRRISEAAQGAGEAQSAIKELGLSAQMLAAQGPEKAFMAIARAMDKVTGEHDRLRIATKLFDDEQAAMHMVLKLNNEEFRKQADRADRLGATISGFDATQMERAKDAISDMNTVFESFSAKFASELAPSLTNMLIEMSNLLEKLSDAQGAKDVGEIKRGFTYGDFLTASGEQAVAGFDLYNKALTTLIQGNPGKEFGGKSPLAELWESGKSGNVGPVGFFNLMNEANKRRIKQEEDFLTERKKAEAERIKTQKATVMKIQMDSPLPKIGKDAVDYWRESDREIPNKLLNLGTGANGFGEFLDQEESEQHRERSRKPVTDPMESITAGSSEAFKITNRINSLKSPELEMAKKRTQNSEETVGLLGNIYDWFQSQQKEFADLG